MPPATDVLANYGLSDGLRPFVRAAMEHWREPWFMEERRILDYLLVYITAGTGRFSVGEDVFDVAPGDLIWIPPDTLHEMRGHAPKMLVAFMHFDLIFDSARSPRVQITRAGQRNLGTLAKLLHPPCPWQPFATWRGKLPVANAKDVYARLKQVIVEAHGVNHPLRIAGLVLQLLADIQLGLSADVHVAGEHWPAMRRAAERIVASPERGLDLGALARSARLSVSHFRKLFRETHGESPRAMHTRARMQKACELVLYSSSNMTGIAEELGFSTVHNFSRAFTREVGVSPRAYKRKLLAKRRL